MGKKGDLSDFERGMVFGARWAGLSISKTAVPVAQWLEHCISSTKVVGSIPREHMYKKKKKNYTLNVL